MLLKNKISPIAGLENLEEKSQSVLEQTIPEIKINSKKELKKVYRDGTFTATYSLISLTSNRSFSDLVLSEQNYKSQVSHKDVSGEIYECCCPRCKGSLSTANGQQGVKDKISQEDLVILQRLQSEFSAELTTLRNRVDKLEVSAAELEANQFSTTTKLTGEAIFAVNGGTQSDADNPNTTFFHRTRLNLETSFTGKDLLLGLCGRCFLFKRLITDCGFINL